MKQFSFFYEGTSAVDNKQLTTLVTHYDLAHIIQLVQQAVHAEYDNQYCSVALPFDTKMHTKVKQLAVQKKALNPAIIIVVGIGGSNLGTRAVQESVLGRYYNAADQRPKIYFADTVDADRMTEIVRVMRTTLARHDTVLINVVTKSGTTMETIINFQVLLSVLQEYYPESYKDFVVVTTNKDSKLWVIGKQEDFSCLEVPEKVGGRYSVFSAVGLFPLALCSIDIDQLLEGARSAVNRCTDSIFDSNPALISAALLAHYYYQGVAIHDLFLFGLDLQSLGKWYRQLTGESIGKEYDIHGKRVFAGITPTVSVGSVDLHSVAQLYLGGPRDKFTTFVQVAENNTELTIPHLSGFSTAFPGLAGKSFLNIMNALVDGTQSAYVKNKRPFCTVVLPQKDAHSIGQFMQFKMIEMMYLGQLLEVDPFDQPNVELYKQETRKILAK